MNNLIKAALFSLLIIGLYTFYSAVVIPPIATEEQPLEGLAGESIKTVDDLVALGEAVYNGKGACALCHNPQGGRAPMLENSAHLAGERIKAPGYRGKATDAEGYLYESLVEPSAYVVPGFGTSGSGDMASPMPDVRSRSIGLDETEIKAVIAYLQSVSGVDITVKVEGAGE